MKKHAVFWALGKTRRRIPAILFLIIAYIAVSLLGVAFALGSRQVIDSAVAGDRDAFLRACLLMTAVIVGSLSLSLFTRHLNDKLTADMDRDWKRDMLSSLLHGEYEKVSSYHTGELLNRMNGDVGTFVSGVLSMIPSIAAMITKLVAAAAVLIAMEPLLTLVIFAGGGVILLATGIFRKKLKDLNKRTSAANGKVSGFLQETLEKLLMVQAMDVSDEMKRRADVLMEDRYQLQRRRKNVSLLSGFCVNVLSYGASLGTLVFCAAGILRGTMSFGTLTAVTQLVGQVQGPIFNLSGVIPRLTAMSAAAERIRELYELEQEDLPQQELVLEETAALRGENLSFAYDRDPVLKSASFTIPAGAFCVITGHSGIGKSTLLKLLLGIYKPTGGQIFLQTESGQIPLDRTTRKLFAYVPQGNLLLSGTLRDNLIITRPDATQEELERAIHYSAMDDYLGSLPDGLDTVVGENSAGLSEGQAQRLSIARAILSDAPVLLLDEATSALDQETEKTVLTRLRELPGKTCIAVTHRPAAEALSTHRIRIRGGVISCEEKDENNG